MAVPAGADWVSARLRLRPVSLAVVRALVDGHRLDDWAEDYPADGDVVIAGLLDRAGPAAWSGPGQAWGHRQVTERSTGLAVGGIGFLGPPEHGAVEVGYGIVPSRQRRGYATEAVLVMAAMAWRDPVVTAVLARTEPGNLASRRVLEKAGFRQIAAGEEIVYQLGRRVDSDANKADSGGELRGPGPSADVSGWTAGPYPETGSCRPESRSGPPPQNRPEPG